MGMLRIFSLKEKVSRKRLIEFEGAEVYNIYHLPDDAPEWREVAAPAKPAGDAQRRVLH